VAFSMFDLRTRPAARGHTGYNEADTARVASGRARPR
jgi:hypothetical protein